MKIQQNSDGGTVPAQKQPALTDLPQMLVDSSIDRLMAIDTSWNIIAWNKTAEYVTGTRASDIIGKHLTDVFPAFDEDKDVIKAYGIALKGFKAFLPADRNFKHRELYENHYIPLRNEDNIVIGVMNIMHDVSHRIKAEMQLQELNEALEKKVNAVERASAELSTYTFITSTSIKEPVKHLYTGLEFLLKSEGRSLSDQGKASLRRMQSSLNRMNLLLNDILRFSQINDHDKTMTTLDVSAVMNKVIRDLEGRIRESGAVVTVQPDLPGINGHEELIELLFHSLLDNALKFVRPGQTPRVEITGGTCIHPSEDLKGKPCIRISFIDRGLGFNPDDNTRIFDLFEKLNGKEFRGSGMGLAISRKIMAIHEGSIEAESIPGEGTSFHCFFPE